MVWVCLGAQKLVDSDPKNSGEAMAIGLEAIASTGRPSFLGWRPFLLYKLLKLIGMSFPWVASDVPGWTVTDIGVWNSHALRK